MYHPYYGGYGLSYPFYPYLYGGLGPYGYGRFGLYGPCGYFWR